MVEKAMSFEPLATFFYMDGQGLYIWAAYGVTLFVLAANVWWPAYILKKISRSEKSSLGEGSVSRNSEDHS